MDKKMCQKGSAHLTLSTYMIPGTTQVSDATTLITKMQVNFAKILENSGCPKVPDRLLIFNP